MRRLVLASSSQARASLLRAAGLRFHLEPSTVDEVDFKTRSLSQGQSPELIAQGLAAAKALERFFGADTVVIGADQTLEVDGRLLDKTASLADTRARLLALRGRAFTLHCAVACAMEGQIAWSYSETASLTFRNFSESYLDQYLSRNAKSLSVSLGGFELEQEGVQLLDRVEGDYFAILGLPLIPLLAWLRQAGGAPL